jgi:hypothetical protein
MRTEDKPHEIVNKETGRIVGTCPNYAQAYAAYEKLGWEMSEHAIGVAT